MTAPHRPLNILLTGASGFIGRHIKAALTAAGHNVHCTVSPRHRPHNDMTADFARDTQPDKWLKRFWLNRYWGIDVVINAVGVLRDSRTRPIDAVHRDTPIALFDACAKTTIQGGIGRVIQISALGIDDNPTRYARTKRAADEHLLRLAASGASHGKFSAAVVRPSVVFGYGGASSNLFMNLARLPLIGLPGPVLSAKVQPIAVTDLAAAVVALAEADDDHTGIIPLTGPEPVKLGDFIASLRQQLGHPPARVLRLPDMLTRLSARAGDWVPISPWCSESLALLAQDNVGDAAVLRSLLGRDAVHYRQLLDAVWRRT